jgi:hypothetical protein
MSEAARQKATKSKMNILAHQLVIKKIMPLHFCLVMPCPYQLLEVDRGELWNYWKMI